LREHYDALAVHVSDWFRRTQPIFGAPIYDTSFSVAVSFVKQRGRFLALSHNNQLNFGKIVVACILLSGSML
jgi:hypothetical protein